MLIQERSSPAYCPQNSRSLRRCLFSLLENHCKTSKQLSQIHARTIVYGFTQKRFILCKLLSLYATFDNLLYAQQLFDQAQNPDAYLWNQIIRSHNIKGSWHTSMMLFSKMEGSSALPDAHTYNFIINGCSRGGLLGEGEQVHAKILRNGFSLDIFLGANLVDFYAKCGGYGGFRKARQVFDEMSERSVVAWNALLLGCFRCGNVDEARNIFRQMPRRSDVSWTIMIDGCTQDGKCREALSLFQEMRRENAEFDTVTLLSVLSVCAELGDLNLGKWIHSYVVELFTYRKLDVPVKLNNALIHMYAGCGEIETALAVFKGMKHRNIVSWNNIIMGFAKQGLGNEALRLFQWMVSTENYDHRPNGITFLGVLCACSHSGYVNEGRYYFRSMIEKWGIEPRIEHFGCMVDLLSRAGLLDEAHDLVKSMPMRPNDVVWGALLGGCRIYRNVDLAREVANLLPEEFDPSLTVDFYALLSNVYAAAKRWRDVLVFRQKMLGMEVRKRCGRSWIVIGEDMHEFLAGDRSHVDSGRIYEVLDEITREASLQGYMPYILDVSMDIDREDWYDTEDD